MRIANKTMYDSVIRNLGRVSTDMFNANEVVSTTKKINRLSDDPVGLVAILGLRSSLENIEQMERNISMGRSWLTASESALGQIEEIFSLTNELCVQLSNATATASQRANSVSLVDGYLRQLIALSNTKSGGRYIFGGTNTDTTTFALNATETQVSYSGNDTPFSIKISRDSNIDVGKDGKDIFGENWDSNNFFKTMIDFKTYLQTDNIQGIQDTIDKLDSHISTIQSEVSGIAGKVIRLGVREKVLQDLELSYTQRKSELEDADIAEAIIDLNSKELAYNAVLASSSKMMELSLVDFI